MGSGGFAARAQSAADKNVNAGLVPNPGSAAGGTHGQSGYGAGGSRNK